VRFTTYEIVAPSAIEVATIPAKLAQWEEQMQQLLKEIGWLKAMMEEIEQASTKNPYAKICGSFERGMPT
jgi:hypothetical protein